MLAHSQYGYGYTDDQILDMPINVFRIRLRDIFEIHSQFNGEGKGRIVKPTLEEIQEHMKKAGVKNPPGREEKK